MVELKLKAIGINPDGEIGYVKKTQSSRLSGI
jgi:hypothetical protein